MYFPLIVHEDLMFEPTETETKETLDEAIRVLGRSGKLRKKTLRACTKLPTERLSAEWTRSERRDSLF